MITDTDALLDDLLFGNPAHRPHGRTSILWAPDDPVTWIETEFYIPETNAAIVLDGYQRAVIQEALTPVDGALRYSVVLWSDLKKSAKSSIAGAVVLWMAWHNAWESCRVVGNDLKQASSRTFYYIERALELNERFRPHYTSRINHIQLDNHTTIDAIPVDPKGEAGGGDLVVCFTELWAMKNDASLRLWTETTLSPLKYGKSLRWCESYAGFTGESPILEQLYQSGMTDGAPIGAEVGYPDLELYRNDAGRLLCLWNTVPRLPWQTADYYAQEAATLTPEEFSRVHRNQWASAMAAFIPIEWWDGCQVHELPALTSRQGIVVGLDAATTNDTFAVVGVSRHEQDVVVRFARAFRPPADGKLDFGSVEAYIRDIAERYNVVEFTYDPYQLHDMSTRLRRAGLGWFNEFPQGGQRLVADKLLFDMIRDRQLVHDGSLHDLREHLANANRKDDGDRLRIVKRAEHMKIDLAVALSMATYEARRLNLG